MKVGKKFYTIIYTIFVKYLPISYRTPFKISKKLRGRIAKHILKAYGKNINIEHGAEFNSQCTCGSNSSIGVNCRLYGPVEIGDDVMMGPECLFYTMNHAHNRTDTHMICQGFTKPQKIIVEDDVWIGSRSIFLPGVVVGRGSVIAAGTVVVKSVPPYSIVAGNPSRIVRNRKEHY
jgi:maltose O-acetyltransferase